MLCISDALASRSEAFIKDADDNLIVSSESIKLLGFHFSHRPTVGLHVEKLRQRFRQRAWILMHLQHAVFSQEELSNVYRVMVRPVADYLSAVYHGMLTDQQDEGLERLQSQALKIIFGKDMIHADMRVRAGVTTLRLRRGEACDKLTQKCLTGKFSHWFPKKVAGRATRGRHQRSLHNVTGWQTRRSTSCGGD